MNYRYEYLSLAAARRRALLWVLAIGLVALTIGNFIVLWRLRPPPSVSDTFEPLNTISPVLTIDNGSTLFDIPAVDERAVVSTLYSESFVEGVLALGRSLQIVNTAARRILLYFPDRISNTSRCQLQQVGWELRPTERIPPPNGGKGVHPRFRDQFSKLRVWSLDRLGIKTVVYLDGDTLVRRNFDELWSIPYQFAAVPDVYGDSRGFSLSFNAGMLVLRTSSSIFDDMLDKIESAEYQRIDAEQGFLNVYFAAQVVRLPHIYNANLVINQRNPSLWRSIQNDARIVHYTMMKPFIAEERSRAASIWETELEQWDAVWDNVTRELRSKC